MHAPKHTYRVALWCNSSVAVNHGGDSGFESQSVPYFLVYVSLSVYPVRDTVRVSIFGVRDSISILSLQCYSTAGTQYLVASVPVTGSVDRRI